MMGEIAKARSSGPDRMRFVTETETPGGCCVNCRITYKEAVYLGPGEATHARLEKPTCVCVCVCKTWTVYDQEHGLYMILHNQYPNKTPPRALRAAGVRGVGPLAQRPGPASPGSPVTDVDTSISG